MDSGVTLKKCTPNPIIWFLLKPPLIIVVINYLASFFASAKYVSALINESSTDFLNSA